MITSEAIYILEKYQNLVVSSGIGQYAQKFSLEVIKYFDNKWVKSRNTLENRLVHLVLHPNYTYEEFIEKPIGDTIQDGIFKQLINSASINLLSSYIPQKIKFYPDHNSKIWKVSLGYRITEERVYQEAKKKSEICVGWLEHENLEGKTFNDIYKGLEARRGNDEPKLTADAESIDNLVNKIRNGDLVLIYNRENQLTDIGIVQGDYFFEAGQAYPHKRKVKWVFEFKKPYDFSRFDNYTPKFPQTIYNLKVTFNELLYVLQANTFPICKPNFIKPFYLLIDNLDQINLAKVFGEYWELLPSEKRNLNSISLLYSRKKISLPSNIYLVSNIRNIKEVYQPLLQKFKYLWLEPDYDTLVKDLKIKSDFKLNPSLLLKSLNAKIIKEKGKEFQLDHTLFAPIENITDLWEVWYFSLLPLIKNIFNYDELKLITILGETLTNKQTLSVEVEKAFYELQNQ